jgi:N-acetylmuramoyl-L-alanine amidase
MTNKMETERKSKKIALGIKDLLASTFHSLLVVIGVGLVVATLFTAWTPVGMLSTNIGDRLSAVLEGPEPTQSDWPTPTARPKPRIGIVAGHTGDENNDPGAICPPELGGIHEVDLNKAVADLVRQYLLSEGFDVDLLEEFDPRLNGYQALALVSIHADSCEYINDQATGFKVSSALASTYPEKASRLTACLRSRYGETTGLTLHKSVTSDMTSYHAFNEIDNETTAAIIEIGFMNLDRQILTQQQDTIAQGITRGILCYIYNEDTSPKATNEVTP